ncbi:unnamed protein product, partial [Ectocarpus sp. 13 AM-2016]
LVHKNSQCPTCGGGNRREPKFKSPGTNRSDEWSWNTRVPRSGAVRSAQATRSSIKGGNRVQENDTVASCKPITLKSVGTRNTRKSLPTQEHNLEDMPNNLQHQ